MDDATAWLPTPAQLRAMTALIETQAGQLHALRQAHDALTSRLSARDELDSILADDLAAAFEVLRGTGDATAAGVVDRLEANVLAALRTPNLGSPEIGKRGSSVLRAPVEDLELDGLAAALRPFLGEDVAERVSLDLPAGLVVRTAPSRFLALVADLVEHAAGATATGDVSLALRVDDGELRIAITDPDALLRHADHADVFEPTTPGGLYLASRLAHSLGGTLDVEGEGDAVRTVVAVLPQRRTGDVRVASHS